MADYASLRAKHPSMTYESYSIEREQDELVLSFCFSLENGCRFEPTTRIVTGNLNILNSPLSPAAKRIAFALGLVEAVSYWKAACPPVFRIKCGELSAQDILWWKKLWWHGLGEFFYRNGIAADFDSFVDFEVDFTPESSYGEPFVSSGINIIPVGGGKDSAVTAELLKSESADNMFFTVNDQPARTACVEAAGYGADRIIKTYRTIDKSLLQLNAQGYLNGHTPFSAIVAFLASFCAYIIGAGDIVLSNEASANESNIKGEAVNHQYSKSYEFECDFSAYASSHFGFELRYFSLLRAFNELQIAKMFASLSRYHEVFRSCNAGSKQNIWCGKCAKCLFVYIILSPFIDRRRLERIFGCNMLDRADLQADFDGLAGFSGVKPFECVGTADEIRAALDLTAQKYDGDMPVLLQSYLERRQMLPPSDASELLGEFNEMNNVPDKFKKYIGEMFAFVSGTD